MNLNTLNDVLISPTISGMNSNILKCSIVLFIMVMCLVGVGKQPLEAFVACNGCIMPTGQCYESGINYPHAGTYDETRCKDSKGLWNLNLPDVKGYTAIPNTIVESRNLDGVPNMYVNDGNPIACANACDQYNSGNSHEKCTGFVYDGYPSLPEGTSPSPSLIKDQKINPAHTGSIVCSFKGVYPVSSEKHNAYGSVFYKNNPSNIKFPKASMSGDSQVGAYKGRVLPSNDNPTGRALMPSQRSSINPAAAAAELTLSS